MGDDDNERPKLLRGRSWLYSQELRRSNSQLSASSPPGMNGHPAYPPPGSPVTDDPDWYKKLACCHLESPKGEIGQAIIVCLGLDGYQSHLADALDISTYPALVLITNHHIIPSHKHLQKWKLRISGSSFTLDENKFIIRSCKSCCGADGVYGKREEHTSPKQCPFQADFTLLPLSEKFSEEIFKRRDLLIPIIMPLNMESLKTALKSQRFYIFQRDDKTGHIREVEVDIRQITPPTDDTLSIGGLIENYKKMCTLSYNRCPEVRPGSSGAGLFLKNGEERVLLGLHVSTSEDGNVHYGTSIHKIFHAIADGRVCGFAPSLSLLKDAHICGCLSPRSYEKLLDYLKPRANLTGVAVVPVQANAEQAADLSSRHVIELLNYLIVEKLIVLDQDNPLTLPSINLLTSVFSLFCSKFRGKGPIKEEIQKVFPDEAERNEFYKRVREAIEKVYVIIRRCQNTKLLETCFGFWFQISFFPLPEPALFSNSAKFSSLKQIRDEQVHNPAIQRLFADICLIYRSREKESKEKEFREALQTQREAFEVEKMQLEGRARDQIRQRERQLEEEMEEQRKQLENQIRQLNTQAEMDTTEIADLKKKIEESEEERGDLDRRLTCSQQRVIEQQLAIEQHQRKNSDLNVENERQAQEISSLRWTLEMQAQEVDTLRRQLKEAIATNSRTRPQALSSQSGNPPLGKYPGRTGSTSLLSPDSDLGSQDFWENDMVDLLSNDTTLREAIAAHFKRIPGDKGSGTWEHMIFFLNQKGLLNMDPTHLDGTDEAATILSIVKAWSKKGKVTVRKFCDICNELGVNAVEELMEQAEGNARNSVSHDV